MKCNTNKMLKPYKIVQIIIILFIAVIFQTGAAWGGLCSRINTETGETYQLECDDGTESAANDSADIITGGVPGIEPSLCTDNVACGVEATAVVASNKDAEEALNSFGTVADNGKNDYLKALGGKNSKDREERINNIVDSNTEMMTSNAPIAAGAFEDAMKNGGDDAKSYQEKMKQAYLDLCTDKGDSTDDCAKKNPCGTVDGKIGQNFITCNGAFASNPKAAQYLEDQFMEKGTSELALAKQKREADLAKIESDEKTAKIESTKKVEKAEADRKLAAATANLKTEEAPTPGKTPAPPRAADPAPVAAANQEYSLLERAGVTGIEDVTGEYAKNADGKYRITCSNAQKQCYVNGLSYDADYRTREAADKALEEAMTKKNFRAEASSKEDESFFSSITKSISGGLKEVGITGVDDATPSDANGKFRITCSDTMKQCWSHPNDNDYRTTEAADKAKEEAMKKYQTTPSTISASRVPAATPAAISTPPSSTPSFKIPETRSRGRDYPSSSLSCTANSTDPLCQVKK